MCPSFVTIKRREFKERVGHYLNLVKYSQNQLPWQNERQERERQQAVEERREPDRTESPGGSR